MHSQEDKNRKSNQSVIQTDSEPAIDIPVDHNSSQKVEAKAKKEGADTSSQISQASYKTVPLDSVRDTAAVKGHSSGYKKSLTDCEFHLTESDVAEWCNDVLHTPKSRMSFYEEAYADYKVQNMTVTPHDYEQYI